MKKYSINDFFAGKVDIRCKNNKQAMAVLTSLPLMVMVAVVVVPSQSIRI